METIWQDMRYGARMLLKNPGFTSIAVFTLALGIGANTAAFSFTDAVLFRALPFAEPERLVMVKGAPGTLVDLGLANPEKFMQWNYPLQSLEYVAAYDSARANLADYLTPERIQVMRVSAGFFPMLGVSPLHGRWFSNFELAPTAMKYETEEKRAALYQTIIERLRAIPGVASAGTITSLPIARGSVSGLPIKVEGASSSGEPVLGAYQSVTADYFRAMDIPLIAGRYFIEGDRAGTANVMLLNQTLARQVFPNENPVGKRIVLDIKKPTLFEVIGVVGDVRTAGLDEAAIEEFYLHSLQYPPAFASFAIKVTAAPASLADTARKTVLEVDRDQPLYRVKTMEEVLADSVTDRQFPMLILSAFAATALLLSTLGVYGVVSYTVTQRTHEMGMRVALGAQSLHVLCMVIGQGMKLVMFGIAIGLVAAFALTRLMRAMLFGGCCLG